MISFEELEPTFIYRFNHEGDLLKAIDQIKFGFTTNREEIGTYVAQKRLVSAYLALYGATNMPKYSEILSRLPQELVKEIGESEFIDFGCGPGTFSFAHLDYFNNGSVVAVDNSNLMLDQARALLESRYQKGQIEITKYLPEKRGKRVLFFGHSINEMGAEFALDKIKKADAEIVMWIEPGTKQSFDILRQVRSQLLEEGYFVQYPCTGQGECPMSEDDWCHQFIKVVHDQSIERLCQLAKLDRRTLPLTAHVYTKKRYDQKDAVIVSSYPRSKHMQQFDLCTNENQLIKFEAAFRGISKSESKELQNKLAGEQLNMEVTKEIKPDHLRGKLS